MSKSTQNFGRNEMAALFGGLPDENDDKSKDQSHLLLSNSKKAEGDDIDYSKLTAAQAAALLKSKAQHKKDGGGSSTQQRHRATKKTTPQHIALANELLAAQQQQQQELVEDHSTFQNQNGNDEDDGDDSDEDDGFVIRKTNRIKTEPRIVMQPKVVERGQNDQQQRRHRRRHDSSSDSSSESESDDSSPQTRRGRRPSKQQQQQQQQQQQKDKDKDKGRDDGKREGGRRRRRDSSSSSSGSNSGSNSSSDSDDASSVDDRRKRLLAKRRQSRQQHDNEKEQGEGRKVIQSSRKKLSPELNSRIPSTPKQVLQDTKKSRPKSRQEGDKSSSSGSSSSSSSSSSGSDDSSSEESSSSSSEEDEPVVAMAKPLFVPKHKRNAIKSTEQLEQEELEKAQRTKELQDKQKMESRTLVAKVVSDKAGVGGFGSGGGDDDANNNDLDDELAFGASMCPAPNDEDPPSSDPAAVEKERDAWELRELGRLMDALVAQEEIESRQAELEQRRKMTDAEVLELDTSHGVYRRPGSDRRGNAGGCIQRYYHRGAFYMDEDTLEQAGKDDVRHKAAEYANEPTDTDKMDRGSLPDVVKVKNFGLSGQNRKYKGLFAEDTTDKDAEHLPVVKPKSKNHLKRTGTYKDNPKEDLG